MLNNLFHNRHDNAKFKLSELTVLFSGISLFVFVTLLTITKSAFWLDEAFTAYIIKFDFVEIIRYTAADVHPPLYYFLLKLWSMLFGNTELALRSMSVLFGVVAIVFGYLLIRRLFDRKSARFSLLLMVISPMFVKYAQEARMYTLMVAVALAATYVLIVAMESKKRLPWITYGVLVALGMWVHYFSAIIWLVHWLWRADNIRRETSKKKFIKAFFSKNWILAHIVAVAVFLPWIPAFIYQVLVVQVSGFWIPIVSLDTMPNFITNVFYYLNSIETIGWLALGLIVAGIFITFLSIKVYKAQNSLHRQSYRLIIFMSFLPIIMLFLLSMPPLRSLFIDRYLNTSALVMMMFIGVTVSLGNKYLNQKSRLILIILLPLMLVYGVGSVWHLGNYNKISSTTSDMRGVIQKIKSLSKPGQPIITDTPWLFYEAVFYETKNSPVYFINEKTNYRITALDMLNYNPQHKIMDVGKFSHDNPVVWYVGSVVYNRLEPPYANWKEIKRISVSDLISNKPAYEAIQFKIN